MSLSMRTRFCASTPVSRARLCLPTVETVSQLGMGGFSLPYIGSTKVEPTLYCDVNENNTSYDTASQAGSYICCSRTGVWIGTSSPIIIRSY